MLTTTVLTATIGDLAAGFICGLIMGVSIGVLATILIAYISTNKRNKK